MLSLRWAIRLPDLLKVLEIWRLAVHPGIGIINSFKPFEL